MTAATGHIPPSRAARSRYHFDTKPAVSGTPTRLIAATTNAPIVHGMFLPVPARFASAADPVR